MNILKGDVLANTINTAFETRELAEATMEATMAKNKHVAMNITYNITAVEVYENENDVPILNQKVKE
jgi:hypothetical protein